MLLFPRLQLAEENAPKEQYYLLREQLLDVTDDVLRGWGSFAFPKCLSD